MTKKMTPSELEEAAARIGWVAIPAEEYSRLKLAEGNLKMGAWKRANIAVQRYLRGNPDRLLPEQPPE